MTVRKSGDWSLGDDTIDLTEVLRRFAEAVGDPVVESRVASCRCGAGWWEPFLDEQVGSAAGVCTACDTETVLVGDDEDAEYDAVECVCGSRVMELVVATAARRVYLGGRCRDCGVCGCYGEWPL